MLRYLTSGESHGRELTAIVDGLPSGLALKPSDIDAELARRQKGYGRGGRQKIEKDRVEITAGVRGGRTLGSPLAMVVRNRDWENWKDVMAPDAVTTGQPVTRPRPGHADLAGAMKYAHDDVRNVLERSSARETAARVAVGAAAKRLLSSFGITVYSWVTSIGGAGVKSPVSGAAVAPGSLFEAAESSEVRCPDSAASKKMIKRIDAAKRAGDSLGGVFEVCVVGVPPGLGSHVQWDRKLDAALARAFMSIQAIKGVEIGAGFSLASMPGSKAHDEIFYGAPGGASGRAAFWPPKGRRYYRVTDNAGGIEGGTSNGEPIIVRAAMKPIPTLYKPLRSVDIRTKKPFVASIERSDITAVPAASVIGEAVAAIEIASAFLDKFSGDSVEETGRNYLGYLKQLSAF